MYGKDRTARKQKYSKYQMREGPDVKYKNSNRVSEYNDKENGNICIHSSRYGI
jgi:hypothetical protein